MTTTSSAISTEKPSRVRYGVLGFACSLAMITYLDRVSFGTAAPYIQKEFGFDKDVKGILFGAFALAYALFEVPSGWLGDVYGPRRTLFRIVIWWSIFTALTGAIYPTPSFPWFAIGALILVQFLFGMGEAGAFPNIARAQANWFPFTERGFAQGAVWMSGRFAGGMTPLVISLLIFTEGQGDSTVTHWRHAFWIFGIIGTVWCIGFMLWFRDRPEDKPGVNAAELALIRKGGDVRAAGHAGVPWKRLLGSRNLWFLCIMYFCGSYGWYFNITWLSSYLKDVHGVTKETAGLQYGLMAGLPLLLGSSACLIGGLLTDFIIRRTGNQKWGRRFCGMLGHGLCGICYLLAAFMETPWTCVLAIAIGTFWNDITMGSAWASCLDIGGRYAGTVSGCMNTIGNLGGAVAGVTTGLILGLFETENEGWHANFILFACVYGIAVVMWSLFDASKPVVPVAERVSSPA
ncbi:MAG TPA: MFS transporter [Gemmataceae bacterium]|jgi:MFS family permease|nr:MFS transporter [Gemmataceae bacterium]